MDRPSVLLLGHSFVHGTLQHLSHSSSPSPRALARHFRLSNLISHLHMYGIRGAKITDPEFTLPAQLLNQYNPTYAILDFGTNDLVMGTDPLNIAVTLYDIANILRDQYNISRVVICSIIPRYSALRNLTPARFSALAHQANHFLKTMCDGDPNIFYHVHPGFWSTHYCAWSRDGVHPNTTAGRKLYLRSVRKAVFRILPKHYPA